MIPSRFSLAYKRFAARNMIVILFLYCYCQLTIPRLGMKSRISLDEINHMGTSRYDSLKRIAREILLSMVHFPQFLD